MQLVVVYQAQHAELPAKKIQVTFWVIWAVLRIKKDYFLTIKTEAIKVQFEEDSDSNIIKNSKKNTIKGATVEKLLEKLTEEEQGKKNSQKILEKFSKFIPRLTPYSDMDFVMAFLLTYRSFTNPSTLLNTCIQRFCYPPSKKNTNSISPLTIVKTGVLLSLKE